MITARNLRISERHGEAALECDVEHGDPSLPDTLWIGSPAVAAQASWDPFVPALSVLAAARGRRLVIEGAVSPFLLRAVPRILRVWSDWGPRVPGVRLTPIELEASADSCPPRTSAAASFFSGGVDSFYTLVANHDRYPQGHPRRISSLVLVHGMDIPLSNMAQAGQVEDSVRTVADRVGCAALVVRTNMREAVRSVDWVVYGHVAVLVGAAYYLRERADAIHVPAAYAADALKPNAVHPVTDSLWSTGYMDVVHDGAEASRGEKIASIARSADAMRYLRVCFTPPEGAFNCGRCEKCLRTMTELWINGVLERCGSFPATPLHDALGQLFVPPHAVPFWQSSVERARAAGLDGTVIAAIDKALGRSAFDASRFGTLMNRTLRKLERTGFSRPAIKRLDERLFGGLGQALLRRAQVRAADAASRH
jgi:hypothetical protein